MNRIVTIILREKVLSTRSRRPSHELRAEKPEAVAHMSMKACSAC